MSAVEHDGSDPRANAKPSNVVSVVDGHCEGCTKVNCNCISDQPEDGANDVDDTPSGNARSAGDFGTCKFWAQTKSCRFGDYCRFEHNLTEQTDDADDDRVVIWIAGFAQEHAKVKYLERLFEPYGTVKKATINCRAGYLSGDSYGMVEMSDHSSALKVASLSLSFFCAFAIS
jgi:hypothetical protein